MSLEARILSLVPSATDWVTDLGLADRLVGVTHECEAPPGTPVVVEPAVHHDPLDPAGVDAAVAAAAAEDRPLYRIDEDRVLEVAPTAIITQELCDVCAVSPAQVRSLSARLGDCLVVTLAGTTLDGVLDDALRLGDALGAAAAAQALVSGLRARLETVARAVRRVDRPGVAFLEWPDPPWAAGHWVPDQIAAAGGVATVGVAGRPSEPADWEAFTAADVLVVGPCGYRLDEAVAAAQRGASGWGVAEVWAVDAHHCFSRPAARLVDGVEALAGILHPEALDVPDPAVARRVTRNGPGGSSP